MRTEFITKLISELTDILKQNFNQDILSIVLFGSIVKGSFTSTSDIDVLVIGEAPIKDWRARDKMVLELTEDIEKNLRRWHAKKIDKGIWKIPGLSVIESG